MPRIKRIKRRFLAPFLFNITADKEELKAAMFNIVDNGIKYTNKGG